MQDVGIFRSWIAQLAGITQNERGVPYTNSGYARMVSTNLRQDSDGYKAVTSNYKNDFIIKRNILQAPKKTSSRLVLTILVPNDSAIRKEMQRRVQNSNQWSCYDPSRYNKATRPSYSVKIGSKGKMGFEMAKNFINECRLQLLENPSLANFGTNNNGFGNLGDRNIGNCNIGDGNNGNFNMGNGNNGNSNFGNSNSGSYNVGDGNSANYCFGNNNSVNGAVGNNIGQNNKFNYFGIGNMGGYLKSLRFTKRDKSSQHKTLQKRDFSSYSTIHSCSNLAQCGLYSQNPISEIYNDRDSGFDNGMLSKNLINRMKNLRFDKGLNAIRNFNDNNQPNRNTNAGMCGFSPDLMVSEKNILEFTTEEAEATILYHIIKGEIRTYFNERSNLNYKTYSSIMSFPKYVNLGPNIPQELTIKTEKIGGNYRFTIIDGSTNGEYGQWEIDRPILNYKKYSKRYDKKNLFEPTQNFPEYQINIVVINKVLTLPKTVDYVIRNTPSISNFSKIKDFFISKTGSLLISDMLDRISNLVGLIEVNDDLNLGSSTGSAIGPTCRSCVDNKFNNKKRNFNDSPIDPEKLLRAKYSDSSDQNKNNGYLSDTDTDSIQKEDSYSYDEERASDSSNKNSREG
ncbi:putative PPE family protein PPE13, partial [Smittium culicis]